MIVPSIGNSASIREKVTRGSLAMASWSVTYGTTEEHSPTPTPASSSPGWANAAQGASEPHWRHNPGGAQHRRAELVDPAHRAGASVGVGDLVPEHHVEHEQRAVA